MVLTVDTDVAYFVLPDARSRYTWYFYLSDHLKNYHTSIPKMNGTILIICKSLKGVVCSAAEAETGDLFRNAQSAIPIACILIHVLKHPQPSLGTPIVTDNET